MLSIIIPVFNEKDNIQELFLRITKTLSEIDYEMIFVDDSTDETPSIIAFISKENPRIILNHRENEKGLSTAVIKGFELASGDILSVMDGDLQHPPELLIDMFHQISNGADIVVPSRFILGGSDGGLNLFRKVISATARYIGKIFLPSLRKVSDPTGGLFMFKKEIIKNKKLNPVGWKILIEVLVMGEYKNLVEIPYTFKARHLGESKLSLKVQFQYLIHLLSLLKRSEKDRRFYVFCLIGLSGVFVDMLVFTFLGTILPLMKINFKAVLSSFIAMISNYFLNDSITWKSYNTNLYYHTSKIPPSFLRFIKYVFVSSFGVIIKSIALFLFYSRLGINQYSANLLAILFASLLNYFLSNHFVWK
jgi:dolichol-phosphate mannosyltransferase